jgi:hypothetical protein
MMPGMMPPMPGMPPTMMPYGMQPMAPVPQDFEMEVIIFLFFSRRQLVILVTFFYFFYAFDVVVEHPKSHFNLIIFL